MVEVRVLEYFSPNKEDHFLCEINDENVKIRYDNSMNSIGYDFTFRVENDIITINGTYGFDSCFSQSSESFSITLQVSPTKFVENKSSKYKKPQAKTYIYNN